MRWMLPLVLLLVPLAGCLDDDDGGGGTTPTPTMTPEPMPVEAVEFTATGPFLGCLGDVAPCIGLQSGPGGASPDGAWFPIDANLTGRAFTSSADTALGDTDCYILDDQNDIIAEPNNGQGPCAGEMPDTATWVFLYSYAEPANLLVLTFPAA